MLAHPATLDGVGTARAALHVAAVHGETTFDRRRRDALGVMQIRAQHPSCGVDHSDGVVFAERADRGVRAQLDRPEHLAPVDVADATHHALIEQHLGDAGARIGIREQQVDDLAEVGVGFAEIWPQAAHAGMSAPIGPAIGLDRRRVEAHRHPVVDLDRGSHLRVRTPPVVATPVEVPRPRHPHVGVEDEAVVPLDLEMLAVALDGLDDPSGLWDGADESGRIEAKHRLAGERCSQGAGRSMDRVAFGHQVTMVRHAPGSLA